MATCWLWHRWGKWGDPAPAKFAVVHYGVETGEQDGYSQTRLCEQCGAVEWRRV